MNNERNYVIGGLIALIVIVGGIYLFASKGKNASNRENATSTELSTSNPNSGASIILPYGKTTLALGQTGSFRGISITPLSVVEDSRCPAGVQCIQAGTVRVNVKSTLDTGATRQDVIKLNATTTVDTFAVSLVSVEPIKTTSKITDKDYRFIFQVRQSPVTDNELIGK